MTASESASTKGIDAYANETFTFGGISKTLSFAGGSASGVVSVGDVGKERRIQNVAAGLISATSTDAINGSQLYSVLETLGFNGVKPVIAGKNIEVTKKPTQQQRRMNIKLHLKIM